MKRVCTRFISHSSSTGGGYQTHLNHPVTEMSLPIRIEPHRRHLADQQTGANGADARPHILLTTPKASGC